MYSRVSFGSHQMYCVAQGEDSQDSIATASPYALLPCHTLRMTLRDFLSTSIVPDSSQHWNKSKTVFS